MAFAATASKRGAFADMDKAAIDVANAFARLSEVTIFELRGEWRRLHRMPPPMRLSPDFWVGGITYKLQERAYGGLSTATARKLQRASADPLGRGAAKPTPPISLKPGTRLVRGVARGHPHGPHPCRWDRVARSALPLPFRGRAKDHGCPLVGPAVLRPQAAAEFSLKGGGGRWRRLISHEPGPPSAARSTPENRPTRASSTCRQPSLRNSSKHVLRSQD